MTAEHIARVGVWIVIASAAAMGQQRDDRAGQALKASTERVVVRTFAAPGFVPSRTVETLSRSGGLEAVTETIEMPDPDGRLRPARETVTETTRTGANAVQIRREVFGFRAPGQRVLLETTRSEQETLPNGSTTTVQNTWTSDVDGRLGLTYRQIQQARSISSDVTQSDTAVFRPGIDKGLQESERIQQTEHQLGQDLRRIDSTLFVRDTNGRFQPIETRSREVRTIGPSESLEEESIQRLDVNGKLALSERNVTRRFEVNGEGHMLMETFSSNVLGLVRSENRLEPSQRVRRTTTPDAAGSGQTVEEVESRVAGSPNEPMRMVQRIVGTTRTVNAEQRETERRVYRLDVNGRLVLAIEETEQATVTKED